MLSWLQDGGGSYSLSPGDRGWTSTAWRCMVGLSETVWAGVSHRADCQLRSPMKAVGAGGEDAVHSKGYPELPSFSRHPWLRMLCLRAGTEQWAGDATLVQSARWRTGRGERGLERCHGSKTDKCIADV